MYTPDAAGDVTFSFDSASALSSAYAPVGTSSRDSLHGAGQLDTRNIRVFRTVCRGRRVVRACPAMSAPQHRHHDTETTALLRPTRSTSVSPGVAGDVSITETPTAGPRRRLLDRRLRHIDHRAFLDQAHPITVVFGLTRQQFLQDRTRPHGTRA